MNLSGVPTATLEGWLNQAFEQYAAVRSGQKVTTSNYSQGDGGKGISFNSASISDLANWISDLQRELAYRGIGHYERRRAIGFSYGPNRRGFGARGRWVSQQ